MILKKFYESKEVDLGSIRAVRDTLMTSFNWGFASAKYDLFYAAEMLSCNLISEVESVIKDQGNPARIWFQLKSQGGRTFLLDGTDPSRIVIEINNKKDPPSAITAAIEPALQLVSIDVVPVSLALASVFVAHSFDMGGQNYANELSRFLTLNGLCVYSGRAFSAGKVSEKVQSHLAKHDIVVAILTESEDPTWIVQEMSAATALEKPLFVLKQEGTAFKEGLLGDMEYIPFPLGEISRTFIPILEGLAQLRGMDVRAI
jgi:hypothetical protein